MREVRSVGLIYIQELYSKKVDWNTIKESSNLRGRLEYNIRVIFSQ